MVKVFLSYAMRGQMYIAKIHKKSDKERSTFHDRADKTAPENHRRNLLNMRIVKRRAIRYNV